MSLIWESVIRSDYERGTIDLEQFEREVDDLVLHDVVPDRLSYAVSPFEAPVMESITR